MIRKRVGAMLLAAVTAFMLFAAPASGLQAEAADNRIIVNNSSATITQFVFKDRGYTGCAYAGMSWEQYDRGMNLYVSVADTLQGSTYIAAMAAQAATYGGTYVKGLDVNAQFYRIGYTADLIVNTYKPMRICMTAPNLGTTNLDYAVLCRKSDGSYEIWGDLDSNPNYITIDADAFGTYAIIYGAKGAFAKYAVASAASAVTLTEEAYVTNVGSVITATQETGYIYSVGVHNTLQTICTASGLTSPTLDIADFTPGPLIISAFSKALVPIAGSAFSNGYEMITLDNASNGLRTKYTNSELQIVMSTPYNVPICADCALAVLNQDGTVSILPDLDSDPSTITVNTRDFFVWSVFYGRPGCFTK